MKRDMVLIRKILFEIEEKYKPGDGLLFGLFIEGYGLPIIAEHCGLLFQQGLITEYKPIYGDNTILEFQIGNLTSSGYDYLELIRNESVWENTKQEVEKKNLPQTIEIFAKIAGIFFGNVIKELNG